MNLEKLNLVELNAQEVEQTEGGLFLHWGWYAGAFGLGFATGTAMVLSA
jgi:hypothetical protein